MEGGQNIQHETYMETHAINPTQKWLYEIYEVKPTTHS